MIDPNVSNAAWPALAKLPQAHGVEKQNPTTSQILLVISTFTKSI